ncbi:MAG: hypothetical protein WCH58_03490 [Candidatus Saccharibacteria bacterium]
MSKKEIYNNRGTAFVSNNPKSKGKNLKIGIIIAAVIFVILMIIAWPITLLLLYVIWHWISTYSYIFLAAFLILIYLRYSKLGTSKKWDVKNGIIAFLIVCFIIFVVFVIYNVWSYFSYQSLLNSSEVVSFSTKIKSEHPECGKITHVDHNISYGDVENDKYTFQLDQSGGCEFKSIQFNADHVLSDDFSETDFK